MNTDIRHIVIGVLNYFDNLLSYKNYKVPFYYSLAGEEKFLLDNFLQENKAEGVYNKVPRGILGLQNINIAQDSLTNRRNYTKQQSGNRLIIKDMHLIPIEMGFEINIIVSNQNQLLTIMSDIIKNLYKNIKIVVSIDDNQLPCLIRIPEDLNYEPLTSFSWSDIDKPMATINIDVLGWLLSDNNNESTYYGMGMQGGITQNIKIEKIINNKKESIIDYIIDNGDIKINSDGITSVTKIIKNEI